MAVRKVTLMDDRGNPAFQAYTNICIVSSKPYIMKDNSRRRELYYLSMFGPKGSGTSLNAIFAALVNASAIRDVYIEDIGYVALVHKSGRLPDFTPSWSCEFAEFGTNRAIHAVVESKQLSLWDPQQAMNGKMKKGTSDDNGKAKLKQQASKSEEMSDVIAQSLEKHPLFFLMVPPDKVNHRLHLAYLDKRCPFPLLDEWSSFIWERAQRKPEIEQLEVWSSTDNPMIAEAYLCYPNIEKMINDVSEYVRSDSREEVAA